MFCRTCNTQTREYFIYVCARPEHTQERAKTTQRTDFYRNGSNFCVVETIVWSVNTTPIFGPVIPTCINKSITNNCKVGEHDSHCFAPRPRESSTTVVAGFGRMGAGGTVDERVGYGGRPPRRRPLSLPQERLHCRRTLRNRERGLHVSGANGVSRLWVKICSRGGGGTKMGALLVVWRGCVGMLRVSVLSVGRCAFLFLFLVC